MKHIKLITLGLMLAGTTLALAQDATSTSGKGAGARAGRSAVRSAVNEQTAEQNAQRAADQPVAEAVNKAREMAQQQMRLAQAGGGGSGGKSHGGGSGMFERQRTARALVIPKDASDAKNLAEVEEDMAVMAHILDKTLNSGDPTARAMGISVFGRFPGVGSTPRNIYIDGTGAIFLLNVDFPLLPSPNKGAAEAKEPANSEWEEARREIADPKSQGGTDPWGKPFMMVWGNAGADGARTTAEYDAGKVDELKKNLITALKNAANIRRLKSDETITLVVTGSGPGITTKRSVSVASKPGTGGVSQSEQVYSTIRQLAEGGPAGDGAKLILRARQADAQAFQTGQLDLDAFSKKVTVLLY